MFKKFRFSAELQSPPIEPSLNSLKEPLIKNKHDKLVIHF